MKLFYKVKQTQKNLQKYFHPSSLNHLIYAHVHCREPEKVDILKKTTECFGSLGV